MVLNALRKSKEMATILRFLSKYIDHSSQMFNNIASLVDNVRKALTIPEYRIRCYREAAATKYEAAPPELMSFIEKQEEYIEQLERESRFCRVNPKHLPKQTKNSKFRSRMN